MGFAAAVVAGYRSDLSIGRNEIDRLSAVEAAHNTLLVEEAAQRKRAEEAEKQAAANAEVVAKTEGEAVAKTKALREAEAEVAALAQKAEEGGKAAVAQVERLFSAEVTDVCVKHVLAADGGVGIPWALLMWHWGMMQIYKNQI